MHSGAEGGARILLVEDFLDAREMYAEFLDAVGHEVVAVGDGRAALEEAALREFDLIILDIALPILDGITVIRRLRERPLTRKTPIITISASVEEQVRASASAAGANLALDKPCLPAELEEAIEQLLDGALERRRAGAAKPA
jgi:CheY-like chemotaxis protein